MLKTPHTPPTEIVSKFNIVKTVETIEHKAGHLEESINEKHDEKRLSLEERIVENILKSSNTEKLIEFTIDNPRTKKIIEDIAEKKFQEFKKEVARECKRLEDNFSNDFKQITHNIIYFGVAVTAALLLIASYS
jgi:hypothetical protein